MQTKLAPQFTNTAAGQEAESILRSCVHCGFCTATCPTYQLLGDELDGPRGRIYLIKQVLEGQQPSRETQRHLDRCLSCRACETTCPSGVQYGRLADIGRAETEKLVSRPVTEKVIRQLLLHTVPYPQRIRQLIRLGRLFSPLLPNKLRQKIPALKKTSAYSTITQPRKMLLFAGCIQSVSSPATNRATAKVLAHLGIAVIEAEQAGCCGALSHHLSAEQQTLNHIRQNIDAWWPHIEAGAEAIINTASGCGSMLKDYGQMLQSDAEYADKAKHISDLSKDISEIIAAEDYQRWSAIGENQLIAFHSPCSLQHGQKLVGTVEQILQHMGFVLSDVADSHLCCGSAGSYSLLQPELSEQLRQNKLAALQQGKPERIVSANIGCQMHLSQTQQPVSHWIELIAEKISDD